MASWLETHAPKSFEDLAIPFDICRNLSSAAVSSNPPHLLIAGPSGVGKTAAWRLVARQVLGPGWKSTTHILQARNLLRSAGAMKKFEDFLRPGGAGKAGSLAGTSSLDAFDRSIVKVEFGDFAPAGSENDILLAGRTRAPVARLIVIEDADQLGTLRQSYLRRMMESEAHTSRFIFTARTPSRILDALRSRCQSIRIPSTSNEQMERRISLILESENHTLTEGLLGDIVHVSSGNLRKGIFLLELLIRAEKTTDRSSLHNLVASTTLTPVQQLLELSLRGRIHEWHWEKSSTGKNVRSLKGAMGRVDELMMKHALAAEDVIDQIHQLLIRGRLLLPEGALAELLDVLARCDASVPRSMHHRIQIEKLLHEISEIGKKWALAV
jgi:DNA polymerase III delta prime subunit